MSNILDLSLTSKRSILNIQQPANTIVSSRSNNSIIKVTDDINKLSISSNIPISNPIQDKPEQSKPSLKLNYYIYIIYNYNIHHVQIKYIGNIDNQEGIWIGIEFNTPIGDINGNNYFLTDSNCGTFIKAASIISFDNHDTNTISPATTIESKPIIPISKSSNNLLKRSLQLKKASLITEHPQGIKGLANLGNTCYLNCILQILCQIIELRTFFLSKHLYEPNDLIYFNDLLKYFMKDIWLGNEKIIKPAQFLNLLGMKFNRFRGKLQQDAMEFLRMLLNELHEEEIKIEKSMQPDYESKEEEKIDAPKIEKSSFIIRIFGGKYASIVRCKYCNNPSIRSEPFFDVSLSIPSVLQMPLNIRGKAPKVAKPSIAMCWQEFSETIELSGYRCEPCNKSNLGVQNAEKSLLIGLAPRYLILNLKRFAHTGFGMKKIDTFLHYDQYFDITSFCSEDAIKNREEYILTPTEKSNLDEHLKIKSTNTFVLYSLHGIVVHGGGSAGGHYTSYVKLSNAPFVDNILPMNIEVDRWFYFTDTRIKECLLDEVLSRSPYVLIYKRIH